MEQTSPIDGSDKVKSCYHGSCHGVSPLSNNKSTRKQFLSWKGMPWKKIGKSNKKDTNLVYKKTCYHEKISPENSSYYTGMSNRIIKDHW